MIMKIVKKLIFLINAITSVIHIIFQFYLFTQRSIGIYQNFLLTENILIAFFFFLTCIQLLKSNFDKLYIKYNIYIWIFFSLCIFIFRPEHTTLAMTYFILPIPQWLVLLAISITSVAANSIYLFYTKNK